MKHIIALGGGGFSMEPDNPLLDLYILGLVSNPKPKICFIPTASGDAQGYIDRFYGAFRQHSCEPYHLGLFRGKTSDIEGFMREMDIFYVGGGNTKNMLLLWRDWGVDQFLKHAYEQGKILAGVSAGAICWFQQGITDSIPGRLSVLSCLGWLSGSCCPHYDGEKERRPAFHQFLREKKIMPGVAIEDGCALHFVDGKLTKILLSHPERQAYHLKEQEPFERPISGEYLGGKRLLIRRAALQDAPFIHKAHMRSIQEVCRPSYSDAEIQAWGNREYREEMRKNGIRNDFVWVVENQGNIEGFAQLRLEVEKKQAELMGLYLTTSVLGKGLGKRLLNLVEATALENEVSIIRLKSTLNALSFYRHHGYLEEGAQTTQIINGVSVRCHPLLKKLGSG